MVPKWYGYWENGRGCWGGEGGFSRIWKKNNFLKNSSFPRKFEPKNAIFWVKILVWNSIFLRIFAENFGWKKLFWGNFNREIQIFLEKKFGQKFKFSRKTWPKIQIFWEKFLQKIQLFWGNFNMEIQVFWEKLWRKMQFLGEFSRKIQIFWVKIVAENSKFLETFWRKN